MYEERREKFSFKSFFLTILLVLLFVFLMLWLFPTKWDLNNLQSNYDLERLSVLYDEIFANNVARMKDAAIGYFTNERMPQKVGESKKLTLQQMYDLHLVLKMKDKDGNPCDAEKSYVEMTKYDEEYRLKVNLSCGDQEDYIIVYLGCYDYCSGGICEKRVENTAIVNTTQTTTKTPDKTPSTPGKTPTTPDKKPEEKPSTPVKYSCQIVNGKYYDKEGNSVSKTEYTKSCSTIPTPITKKYMYEYKLVVDDKTTCTGWSSWSKTKVSATNNVKVDTKVENEIVSYNTVKVQTGTKKETVVTGQKAEKYVVDYLTELVVVDTKKVQTGTTTKKVTEKVQVGTVEKYVGIDSGSKVPSNTSTKTYKVISTDKSSSCSYCEDETIYTWEIWSIEPVYDVVTTTKTVPVYKTIKVYGEKTTPIYDYKWVDIKETKTTPVYKTVKVPVYQDVTYYRKKTCTVTKGSTTIKWSSSNLDTTLIGKGYKLTGNVKEV